MSEHRFGIARAINSLGLRDFARKSWSGVEVILSDEGIVGGAPQMELVGYLSAKVGRRLKTGATPALTLTSLVVFPLNHHRDQRFIGHIRTPLHITARFADVVVPLRKLINEFERYQSIRHVFHAGHLRDLIVCRWRKTRLKRPLPRIPIDNGLPRSKAEYARFTG